MKNRFSLFCFFLLLLLSAVYCHAQNTSIDSLNNLLKIDKEDTTHVRHLTAIASKYLSVGRYDSALVKSNKSLQLSQKLNFRQGIISSYSNLGLLAWYQGDFQKALDLFFTELQESEKAKNKKEIGISYHHIGIVYAAQANNPKGLEYYFKALNIYDELNNSNGTTTILGNIGLVYLSEDKYEQALDYSNRALKLFEKQKDEHGIARQYYNIGIIYGLQSDYVTALDYYFKSLELCRKLEYLNVQANVYSSIANVYLKQGNVKAAIAYNDSAIAMYNRLYMVRGLAQAYISRAVMDSTQGNFLGAYMDYKLAKQWGDSATLKESADKAANKEMSYEFEKSEAARKADQIKKDIENDAKDRKQKIITWSVLLGLIFMLVFAGFIFRSLRITRKQNHIIEIQKSQVEKQKEIVEENQRHIIGSITYAKRLQEAILPPTALVKKHFPESFILYTPKDIVAGDFYWFEQKNGFTFLAAADCTGHGVPGAMVSVVCSNALNRAVLEMNLTNPGEILDKVTSLVVETFQKSSEEVKDGMDISLISCEFGEVGSEKKMTNSPNSQLRILNFHWAGANNPLWIVRKNQLIEIKGDKQPIGQHDNHKPFTSHKVDVEKGDAVYLFTDGFADQFGGPHGKKYKYKQLSEKLIAIHNLSMEDQKDILEKTFAEWKGSLEQVDDVCVVGIRI